MHMIHIKDVILYMYLFHESLTKYLMTYLIALFNIRICQSFISTTYLNIFSSGGIIVLWLHAKTHPFTPSTPDNYDTF